MLDFFLLSLQHLQTVVLLLLPHLIHHHVLADHLLAVLYQSHLVFVSTYILVVFKYMIRYYYRKVMVIKDTRNTYDVIIHQLQPIGNIFCAVEHIAASIDLCHLSLFIILYIISRYLHISSLRQ